ncbi:MAG: hypothetical protein RI958_106 [Actinomycetota bacterium]
MVVIVAGVAGGGTPADSMGSSDPSSTPPAVLDSALVPVTAAVPLTSTVPDISKTVLSQPLTIGAAGTEVKQLQQRLTDLGFAPGPIDGSFGEGTQQAVWAYKKLVGGMASYRDLAQSDSATVVTPELWSQMQDSVTISPRRRHGSGVHVEVYLPIQVMVVFENDQPALITHISSGELDEAGQPAQWCETVTYDTDNEGRPLDEPVTKGECAYSKTPGGVFRVYRRVEGNRLGPLGGMYNPLYINYGIAIHGAKNVPRIPASHGCIRISMDIAEYFPDLVPNRTVVYVWGHNGKEPEQNTKDDSLPSFNAPDPNATTTTSSTTTTTTTPAPTTTAKPVTSTTRPAAPTTAPPPVTTQAPVSTPAP